MFWIERIGPCPASGETLTNVLCWGKFCCRASWLVVVQFHVKNSRHIQQQEPIENSSGRLWILGLGYFSSECNYCHRFGKDWRFGHLLDNTYRKPSGWRRLVVISNRAIVFIDEKNGRCLATVFSQYCFRIWSRRALVSSEFRISFSRSPWSGEIREKE